MIRNIYLLNGKEFYLLLNAAEVKMIMGVDKDFFSLESLTELEYLYHIYDMMKNGILTNDNNSLAICEEYKELIRIIKDADSILTFSLGDKNISDVVAYKAGNMILTMQENLQNSSQVKLECIHESEFMDYLLECSIIPEEKKTSDIAHLLPTAETTEEIRTKYSGLMEASAWNTPDDSFRNEFWTYVEIYNYRSEWERVDTFGIVETDLNYCILTINDNLIDMNNYNTKKVSELMAIDYKEKQ